MKSTSPPLKKGESQLTVKATVRHGTKQINDSVSVTFNAEADAKAMERYREWMALIFAHESAPSATWELRCLDARRLLKAVMDHIKPLIDMGEAQMPVPPTTEHPIFAEIRALLENSSDTQPKPRTNTPK